MGSNFLIITYEVEGTPYTVVIRNLFRQPTVFLSKPDSTVIQYNPRHPARFYYAPARTLAYSVIAMVALIAGLAITIWCHPDSATPNP